MVANHIPEPLLQYMVPARAVSMSKVRKVEAERLRCDLRLHMRNI